MTRARVDMMFIGGSGAGGRIYVARHSNSDM